MSTPRSFLVLAFVASGCGAGDARGYGLDVYDDPRAPGRQLDGIEVLEPFDNVPDTNMPVRPGCGTPCQPSVLASGLRRPGAVVASGGEVFWIEESASGRVLRRLAVDTGEGPRDLASLPGEAADLALDATRVFWTARSGAAVSSVPRTGGTPSALAPSRLTTSLALDGTSVLLSTSDGAVQELPKIGGSMMTVATTSGAAVNGVAADASGVYWVTNATTSPLVIGISPPVVIADQPGALYVRGRSGGIARRLASQLVVPSRVITDAELVFVSVYGTSGRSDGRVVRVAKATGATFEIAKGQGGALGLTVDATYVYWTTFEGGTVMRRRKDGAAAAEVLASGLDRPQGLTLDPAAAVLYWTVRGAGSADGSLMRLAL